MCSSAALPGLGTVGLNLITPGSPNLRSGITWGYWRTRLRRLDKGSNINKRFSYIQTIANQMGYQLTRISHQLTTPEANTSGLVGLLDVPSSTPAVASVANLVRPASPPPRYVIR